ncbi:hypothetical protein G6F22_019687 [Rhizopus arrhizus]|nr:hypothetical protein G6F22_019687 [Rhizopus arrhizus]
MRHHGPAAASSRAAARCAGALRGWSGCCHPGTPRSCCSRCGPNGRPGGHRPGCSRCSVPRSARRPSGGCNAPHRPRRASHPSTSAGRRRRGPERYAAGSRYWPVPPSSCGCGRHAARRCPGCGCRCHPAWPSRSRRTGAGPSHRRHPRTGAPVLRPRHRGTPRPAGSTHEPAGPR